MSKRMRIGYFIDTFFPMVDGVVMVVDNYARRLSAVADVTVFATHMGESIPQDLPYRVVRCKSIPFLSGDYRVPLPDMDVQFQGPLKWSELDIVHVHSPFFVGKAGMRYAKAHRIPSVATLHTQFLYEYRRVFRSEAITRLALSDAVRLYDQAREVWTVNKAMTELYVQDYGGESVPVVMSNATDMQPCEDRTSARNSVDQKYAIAPDERVFLFVGRLDMLKNLQLIVDALKHLNDQAPFPFRMLFAGTGRDEALLRSEVARLGLEDRVTFCGKVCDRAALAALYCRADLFLFPSLFDTNSLVQIEAASQSTPTLFIRGSVTSSSVTDDVNGFMSDNSAEAYAARIVEITTNPAHRETVARGAFRDLYTTWDTVTASAFSRYQQLIEQNKAMSISQQDGAEGTA